MQHTLRKSYAPFVGAHDPCPPMRVKQYVTHPALYVGFQPLHLPQFAPHEALRAGTLWPIFYDPYPMKQREADKEAGK